MNQQIKFVVITYYFIAMSLTDDCLATDVRFFLSLV